MTLTLSVGIPAYNEERNIANLLDHLLDQEMPAGTELREIIVVASGCTDRMPDIVREYERKSSLVKLIIEEERRGHASAVTLLIQQARGDILIIGCADTQPARQAVGNLVTPFLHDGSIGAVVGRAVPVNDPNTLWGYMAHLVYEWNYLPQFLMIDFEGMSAMRRELLEPMPLKAIYTERLADVQVRRKGLRVIHAPEAVTYTRQTDNLHDFVKQRRRNTYMHLMQRKEDIPAPHIDLGKILPLLLKSLSPNPKKLFFLTAMLALWSLTYVLGWADYLRKVSHLEIWKPIESAKKLS